MAAVKAVPENRSNIRSFPSELLHDTRVGSPKSSFPCSDKWVGDPGREMWGDGGLGDTRPLVNIGYSGNKYFRYKEKPLQKIGRGEAGPVQPPLLVAKQSSALGATRENLKVILDDALQMGLF